MARAVPRACRQVRGGGLGAGSAVRRSCWGVAACVRPCVCARSLSEAALSPKAFACSGGTFRLWLFFPSFILAAPVQIKHFQEPNCPAARSAGAAPAPPPGMPLPCLNTRCGRARGCLRARARLKSWFCSHCSQREEQLKTLLLCVLRSARAADSHRVPRPGTLAYPCPFRRMSAALQELD